MSGEVNGRRFVAVNNRVLHSDRWRTFHDFLGDFIKTTLGPEWGNLELKKPDDQMHPVLIWYRKFCLVQQAAGHAWNGSVYSADMTGAIRMYLGLAYDLYLTEHNAELPELLLRRLRNGDRGNFEGALYEAFVVGLFARAGFTIEFEDEQSGLTSHCEFTATHRETGRKFSVEAKMISSISQLAGASMRPATVREKLTQALRKDADHERIVFIELNRVFGVNGAGEPDWLPHIEAELAELEQNLVIKGVPAPPAYLFVTNRGSMNHLDDLAHPDAALVWGFKIPDYPPGRNATRLLDAVEGRRRHIEPHLLFKAIGAHADIPSTFDDTTPEEAFAATPHTKLYIGGKYPVEVGEGRTELGVLTSAIVAEDWKEIVASLSMPDGHSVIVKIPISDEELVSYRRSPETYFGEYQYVGRGIKTPLEAFDFMFESYGRSSRANILEFLKDDPDYTNLGKMSREDLVDLYCERMAMNLLASGKRPQSPQQPSAGET